MISSALLPRFPQAVTWLQYCAPQVNKLVAILVLAASVVPAAQQPIKPSGPKTRAIHFTGTPLIESLRSDDEVVEVDMPFDSAMPDRDVRGYEALRAATRRADAIAITVDVGEVKSGLAMEGAWVNTTFRGVVAEVHRIGRDVKREDRVSAGESIAFYVGGGEVKIGNVLVRALPSVPYKVGRYVVFLGQNRGDDGWSVTESAPLLVEGRSLTAVAPAVSRMSGTTLDEMKRAARH